MSFSDALSPRQGLIWALRRRGFEPVEIAKELGTSRQFVHQTLNAANSKVSKLLTETAQANRIEVQLKDVRNGVLAGYHRGLEKQAVVSYSAKHGVQVWYWYENPATCEACESMPQCRDYLLDEAEEREIPLTTEEKMLPPGRLARLVFSRLIPEVEP
ncbi:MAG: hypothetical protein QW587_11910 [Candidatus Bathyarchaeia archaeon]